MSSGNCLLDFSTLCTRILPIVACNLGFGVLARPHLPPLSPSFAERHDLAHPSQDYWDVGSWYHSSHDAEEATAWSDVLHASQPPSLLAMAIQPAELQLAPNYYFPAMMQYDVGQPTSTKSREILDDVQSNPSLAPGSRMFARHSSSTRNMLRREDFMASFDSNKPIQLDRNHEPSDASVSGFSFFANAPLSSLYHEPQIHAEQPQLQQFAFTGQSSSSVFAPESTTVASSSRHNTDSSDVKSADARQLESPGLTTWDDALGWLEQHYPKQFPDDVPLEDVPFHQQDPTSTQDVFRQPPWLGNFESGTPSTSGLHTPYGDNFVEEHLNSSFYPFRSCSTEPLSESRIHEQRREAAEVQGIPSKIMPDTSELSKKKDVDEILNRASMSKDIMSNEFLERFTSRFEDHTRRIFAHVRTYRSMVQYTVPRVPVKIYPEYNKSFSLVVFNFENVDVHRKTKTITRRYKKLMEWLVFSNTVSLRNLNLNKTFQEELDSHRKLSDWLFTQCFHPADSYPIHGFIHKEVNIPTEEKFGNLQKLILKYLEFELDSTEARPHALEIMRIYSRHSDDFQDRPNNPTTDFKSSIAQAIDSRMIVETERSKKEFEQLGNLMILKLDSFPSHMKPIDCRTGIYYRSLDFNRGGSIIEKVTTLRLRDCSAQVLQLINRKSHLKKPDYKSNDIEGSRKLPGENRVIKHGLAKPDWGYLQPRLKFLILNLTLCQRIVSKYLSPWSISMDLEHDGNEFFQWFESLLFQQQDDKMPIFGQTRSNDSKVHLLPKLDLVQLYLVDYIFDQDGSLRTVQVALALVGFWYKKEAENMFNLHFKNDLEFWNEMIRIFSELAGPTDQYNFSQLGKLSGIIQKPKKFHDS